MTNLIDQINAASLREDIPAFRAGDTIKVHVKVIEVAALVYRFSGRSNRP